MDQGLSTELKIFSSNRPEQFNRFGIALALKKYEKIKTYR